MIFVGRHEMSFSVSVFETTYFCPRLIQSENASPDRSGHAAADT